MVDPKQNDPAPSGDPLRGADEVRSVEQAAHLTAATGSAGTTGEASAVDHAGRLESEHEAQTIAGAIYGTILATTVVASLGYNPEKLEKVDRHRAVHVAGVLGGTRLCPDRRGSHGGPAAADPRRDERDRSQRVADAAVVTASRAATAAGRVGIISRENAADIAMLVGIGALFVYGVVLGLREGRGSLSVFWNALVVGSFGVLILLLKIVVH